MSEAIQKAKSLGIFIISESLTHDYGFKIGKAYCCPGGDIDNIKDFNAYTDENAADGLFLPTSGSAAADGTKMGLYMYSPFDIHHLPWLTGLYALAKSVNREITPEEFWKKARQTAVKEKNIQLINPAGLFADLQKE